MKFSGWIYDSIACPVWTKVFDTSIDQNSIFSNCPWDELAKDLIECDLAGHINRSGCSYRFIDSMFDFCGVNLKECYNTKSKVLMNGQPVFTEVFTDKPQPLWHVSVGAQLTFIDEKYVYFNMTSYDFWDPIEDYLKKELHSINLGGWLLEINRYPTIKKFIFRQNKQASNENASQYIRIN